MHSLLRYTFAIASTCSSHDLKDREPFHVPYYLSPWLDEFSSQQLLCLKPALGQRFLFRFGNPGKVEPYFGH